MSKPIEIKYDEAGNPDEATLPKFGERVLGTTIRKTPLLTKLIYDAWEAAGFSEKERNETISRVFEGKMETPSKVKKELEKHPVKFTRSAFIEMYRCRQEDRTPQMQKFKGEWAWVSDAMPLVVDLDMIPTHYVLAPIFEL